MAEQAEKVGHTPGPWMVEDPFDHCASIVEAGKPTHEWRFIAQCDLPDGDGDQSFTGREVWANARLIAAAPDLLEACHALAAGDWLGVQRFAEDSDGDFLLRVLAQARNIARAAIAKAEA